MRNLPPFSVVILFGLLVAVSSGQEPVLSPNQNSPEPKSEKEYVSTGRSLLEKGQYEKAIPEFERAIAINPKNNRYYNNLGFCLKQLRRDDEAIAAFNQAIALDSRDSYPYLELGLCYYEKKDINNAIDFVRAAISLNPSDMRSHRWLGYLYYQTKDNAAAINALDDALKISPDDFEANYWRGVTSFRVGAFNDGSRFLTKAVQFRPKDFEANLWLGMSLVREGKLHEALPRLEQAHEIRPNDKNVRLELFAAYLVSNQPDKAGRIYPRAVGAIAAVMMFLYCIWFVALLPFSLRVRAKAFPGFWFSITWIGLLFEGQSAFLFLLASLPSLGAREGIVNGAILAGLPIVAVAFAGFARQPWGESFRWPLRFGGLKIIVTSISLIFITLLIGGLFAHGYTHLTHKPFPLQRTIPLIRGAVRINPITAWIGVALVIPCVEEVLFRGLLFGAFQKFIGPTGTILATAFVFACVHLQLSGFLALFLLGLILGWARLKSGSLGLPIALHGLNNAIALAVLTFGPSPPTG